MMIATNNNTDEEVHLKSNESKLSLEQKQTHNFCSKQLDALYDILAVVISLFDIITDVWIMIEWYYHGKIVFFTISLVIIILSNFAYIMVFFSRYGELNLFHICGCCCFMLPIAPFLSFFMYIIDTFNLYVGQCLFFNIDGWKSWQTDNESRTWMENKLSKHIGFIFETIMESFPQCILQMIAIVYFNEPNIIAIISIIISMISIASKSLIFSSVASINIKTMIFTWFYFVADIFSILFILSFVFYEGNDINQNIIQILRTIWLYKLYIFTAPTCFILSIPVYVWGISELQYRAGCCEHGIIEYACLIIICFIFIMPLWILGMILGIILLETLCYSYIACIIHRMGHGRVPTNKSTKTWKDLIHWVGISSDPIVRICCVNRQLLLMKNNDNILHNYLEKKEHSTQYSDVTYKSLKRVYSISIFWKRFKDIFLIHESIKWSNCLSVSANILLIWYMISRLIVLLFPVFIIIIFSVNGYLLMHDLPMFQMVMLFVMLGMIFIMILLFCFVYNEERKIFYILPMRSKRLYMNIDSYLFVLVNSYYDRLIIKPHIKNVLLDMFGNDIGTLLYEFLPFGLEEEEHATQLRNKANTYTREQRGDVIKGMVDAGFRRYFHY
eukprot:337110_1